MDSVPPSQDLLTLGWLWPRSRVRESACVLRAFDLSPQGVHIPRKRGSDRVKGGERAWNGWYRLLIGPTVI